MKNIKNKIGAAFLLFLCSCAIFAQNTPREFQELVGEKARYLDSDMEKKGYIFIKNEKSDNDSYSYYWNNNKKKCITTRTNNGYVKSIVSTMPADCGKGGHSNDHANHNKRIDIDELKGMKSKAAYVSLEQHGYSNTKTFQEDDVTYKLWFNSKNDHCVKTYSKNYYIARIENSNNCK